MALQLPVSESSLRHLLKAAQAPPEDQLLASQGKVSRNELVRRAKAAEADREVKKLEALERKRAQASLVGCMAICDWLRSEGIPGAYGEQIICAAQRQLAIEEENNWLPSAAPPPGMPTAEIIQKCRPTERKEDGISSIVRFTRWLVLWAYFSMTDSLVRYNALEQAHDKQFKR